MSEQKVVKTYSLEAVTVDLIERLAKETKRSMSAIIDLALEEYLRNHASEFPALAKQLGLARR